MRARQGCSGVAAPSLPPRRNSSSAAGAELTGPSGGCQPASPGRCSSPSQSSPRLWHRTRAPGKPSAPPQRAPDPHCPNPPPQAPAERLSPPPTPPANAHPPSSLLIPSSARLFGATESIKWLQGDRRFQGRGAKEEPGERTAAYFPSKYCNERKRERRSYLNSPFLSHPLATASCF